MKRHHLVLSLIALLISAAVAPAQTVSVDRQSLSFVAQTGGAAVTQNLSVTGATSSVMFITGIAYPTPAPAAPWLSVSPASGPTPSTLTVTANPAGLPSGAYTATLNIAQFGGASSVSVSVTFAVSPILVDRTSLQFTYQSGGAIPLSQTVNLTGAASFIASATTTSGGNWLQATPASGSSPGFVVAAVNFSGSVLQSLSPGTYNGSVVITSTSGTASGSIAIPVKLVVSSAPQIEFSTTSLAFQYQTAASGGTHNTTAQTIRVTTGSTQSVNFSLINFQLNPNPGRQWFTPESATSSVTSSSPADITVRIDPTGLAAGTYNGSFEISSSGSPAVQAIALRLIVAETPLLGASPSAISFVQQLGAAPPAARSVTVSSTSSAAVPLAFSTSPANSWLVLQAPSSPTTGTPFSISVNPTGLAPGNYNGTVTVTGTGAANSPQIAVSLKVSDDPALVLTTGGCIAPAQSCALNFAYQSTAPPTQTVQVASSTATALNYSVSVADTSTSSCGSSWLSLGSATSGGTNGVFTVTAQPPASLSAPAKCTATITISGTDPSNGAAAVSPLSLPVALYVSSTPLLVPSVTGVNFTSPAGGLTGSQVQSLTITLSSTSSADVLVHAVTPAMATCGNNWLGVTPATGTTATGLNTIRVFADPAQLTAGTCTGTLTITAATSGGTAADNASASNPLVIPVRFQVTAGTLSLSPSSLSFTQAVGGSAPAAQTVAVAGGGQTLTYSATVINSSEIHWLSATPVSGTTAGSGISVSVDGSALPAGDYAALIRVAAYGPGGTPVGSSPGTVTVRLKVAPTLSVPSSLSFTQIQGAAPPAAQSVSVASAPGTLSFTTAVATSDGAGWLTATPALGTTPATLQVSVNGAALTPGTYNGSVIVTSAGAIGSPATISITMVVVSAQTIAVSPQAITFTHIVGQTPPAAQSVQIAASAAGTPFTATAEGGSWLSISPASGSAPSALTVSVNTAGLEVKTYTGTVTVRSPNASSPAVLAVTLKVVQVPTPSVVAVKNNASWLPGKLSPGENIVIGGTGLGPENLAGAVLTPGGSFPTTVGDTQVFFDDVPAPILYAWSSQTSVMVPYEIGGRPNTTIRVVYKGVRSDPVTYDLAATAPGIYTLNQMGTGPGAILNQDGVTVNSALAPAAKDSVVAVYMTGEGGTSPASLTGGVAPGNGTGLYKTPLEVTATVGGQTAKVEYYGSAPAIIYGVMQVNVRIPAQAASGAQQLVISVGGTATQAGVTVAVR